MGQKLGAVHLGGGGAGSPSNTMWPGPRPTCMPRFILILIPPTVWPQYTNVTDRQDRTDRLWSDSIGRTVLQTVVLKLYIMEAYLYSAYYELLICKRSGWHVLTRDHTVLPATHMCIHKCNEPHLPLTPAARHHRTFAGTRAIESLNNQLNRL